MQSMIAWVFCEIKGALRYKWHGMAFAWAICVVGWIGVSAIPNTFESKAVLYIDTATVLRPLLEDLTVNTNVMSEVNMMTEVLLSRPQLARVIRDTDMDLRAESDEDMAALLTHVRRKIVFTGSSARNSYNEQNLYTIKYSDTDPKMAHDMVQSLLDSFVEKSLGQNKEDSVGAQRFIADQIQKYEIRLADAEQELAEFKKKNAGLMPSEGQDFYQRLQVALDQLDKDQTKFNTINGRRDELQRQIDGEVPTFGLLASPESGASGGAPGNDALELYEQELASLLLKYTDKHPKVIGLRDTIEQMRGQQDQLLAQSDGNPTYKLDTDLVNMNSLDLNPVYQSLRISISQASAELSGVGEQVAAAKSRVAYLRRMVDTIPEIEAQLARLNRDYEVNKAQHTALLKRLESARLSEEAEFRNEELKFRIIEPPVIPLRPVGPHRVLFATVVLIAGFGLGGAMAFFLSTINPVFNSMEELRQDLQLPILGAISAYRSDEQKVVVRKDSWRFTYAAVALLVMYVLSLTLRPLFGGLREMLASGGLFT